MKFQISKLPYAVLIDESGTIRAKGLVNSREQLESLFTAKELGVASVQEFLATGATLTRPAFRARRTAMHWLDKLGERAARSVAHATSRRSVLNRIGRLFVGAAFIMPVLPVARAAPAAKKAADRRDRLRLLALLRGGRLPVLLRRQHDVLPAGHLAIGCVLGRHLPQSAGRQGLPDQLQRLLRQDRLRQVHVRGGRARAAGLSDVPAQRRELVHVERVVHLPLHHVGDRGPGQANHERDQAFRRGRAGTRRSWRSFVGAAGGLSQDRAASGEATLRGGARDYVLQCAGCHRVDGRGSTRHGIPTSAIRSATSRACRPGANT